MRQRKVVIVYYPHMDIVPYGENDENARAYLQRQAFKRMVFRLKVMAAVAVALVVAALMVTR